MKVYATEKKPSSEEDDRCQEMVPDTYEESPRTIDIDFISKILPFAEREHGAADRGASDFWGIRFPGFNRPRRRAQSPWAIDSKPLTAALKLR